MIVLFFLLSFFTLQVWGNGQITEIRDHRHVVVDIFDLTGLKIKSKVIIVSRETNKAIAFGTITFLDEKSLPAVGLIRIDELPDRSLVLVKDLVYPLDHDVISEKRIPGFTSLTLQGNEDIPAQFKELAYFGVFTAEGHTLDAQEVLLSPFQIQYGITNDFGIKVVNALWLDGYLNAGFKYRVLRNKYAKITVNSLGAYKVQSQDYIWQAGGVITLPTNASFKTI